LINDYSEMKRYELKYTISSSVASEIRDYIRDFFSLDEHVPPGETQYTVNSLYFDTPELSFYYDTKFRKLTRYKLRVRYYGDRPTDSVWTEIKYRNSSVIWKTRHRMPFKEWPAFVQPRLLVKEETVMKERMDSFEEMIFFHDARPALHVSYVREPYVTQLEEYGRITFDRHLKYSLAKESTDLSLHRENMLYYDDPGTSKHYESPVILEIKVETLVPFWVIDIVRTFGLVQRGFSKYCYGLDNNREFTSPARNPFFA